jgi:hypothetical protein
MTGDAKVAQAASAVAAAGKTTTAAPKKKKLAKSINGTVITIVEAVSNTTLTFDFAKLPKTIQENLGPFGLGHKLGDAAAGKEGKEAVDSINKVAEGLMKGDWSVRAPAAEKISKNDLAALYAAMPEGTATEKAQKVVFKGLLEKLGVKIA